MLCQLLWHVKTIQKKSKHILQKHGIKDLCSNTDNFVKMDIENICDSCNTEQHTEKLEFSKRLTFSNICDVDCLKLVLSLTFLFGNIVIISLILFDIESSKISQTDGVRFKQRQMQLSKDLCVDFLSKNAAGSRTHSIQCFDNMAYLRYFFDMVTLSWNRRLTPSDNVNEIESTVARGFLQGCSVSDKDYCPKPTTKIKMRNFIGSRVTSTESGFICNQTAVYMIYLHLNLVNLERCPSKPTEIKLENSKQSLIKDVIHNMSGILVSQAKFYTAFIKLYKGAQTTFTTTDASIIESHWRTNVFGSIRL